MSAATASKTSVLRTLVVENHRDTLTYIQMFLESLGHTVTTARNVREAREALDKGDYDVLISDIGLPDGNGWELLQQVRAQGHQASFAIAMSGFGLNADHVRSQEAGFRHHLLKPFTPRELEELLQEAARELPVSEKRG